MQLVGKVLWWNDRDGFGVIEDAAGNEYYFDSSAISTRSKALMKRNQIVNFELNQRIKDALCACQIRVPSATDRKRAEVQFDKEAAKAAAA